MEVWQIGNEGGFLAAPVNLTADHGNRLLMGLAERADVIVDFTNVPTGQPRPRATSAPTSRSAAGFPATTSTWPTLGRPARSCSSASCPRSASTTRPRRSSSSCRRSRRCRAATVTRQLALIEEASEGADEEGEEVEGPVEALLGTVAAGVWTERKWMDPVTENPAVGATEVWEIYNTTADAHPMHIHEIAFEVVNREGLVLNAEGEVAEPIQLDGDRHSAGAVGNGLQGHRHRLPRPGHPRAGAIRRRPASSCGTATSSSTRTTR